MAVLTAPQVDAISRQLMREWSVRGTACGITKPALTAAIVAADGWVDSNAASYNTALPAGARAALAAGQKAEVLMYIAAKRSGAVLPRE